MKINKIEMDNSLTTHINPLWVLYIYLIYTQMYDMNEMNDGPARDSNPQPLVYQATALPK